MRVRWETRLSVFGPTTYTPNRNRMHTAAAGSNKCITYSRQLNCYEIRRKYMDTEACILNLPYAPLAGVHFVARLFASTRRIHDGIRSQRFPHRKCRQRLLKTAVSQKYLVPRDSQQTVSFKTVKTKEGTENKRQKKRRACMSLTQNITHAPEVEVPRDGLLRKAHLRRTGRELHQVIFSLGTADDLTCEGVSFVLGSERGSRRLHAEGGCCATAPTVVTCPLAAHVQEQPT